MKPVSATDALIGVMPVIILAIIGGIAVAYLTGLSMRRLSDMLPIMVAVAIGVFLSSIVVVTPVSGNETATVSTVPKPPDLSSLERDICDLDFKIRSAPSIYSDDAMLEAKLHELMSAQAVKIDEYDQKVDDWNYKFTAGTNNVCINNVCWGAQRLQLFGGCD